MNNAASPETASRESAGAAGRVGQLPWLLLSLGVIALDQWTKSLVLTHMAFGEVRAVLPVLNLSHQHNFGAAFSFLDIEHGWQRWLFTALAIGVSAMLFLWLKRLPRNARLLGAALGFILGGAVGNLIDRLRLGYVVDMVQAHWHEHYFWTFNVADSAITVGAALLLFDALFGARRATRDSRQADAGGRG